MSLNEFTSKYCVCDTPLVRTREAPSKDHVKYVEQLMKQHHFKTLEEVKATIGQAFPTMTKDEMYDILLKPYKHRKIVEFDHDAQKQKVSYYCQYDGCNKFFTKTWNLLDHVRMHEGVKPYQ